MLTADQSPSGFQKFPEALDYPLEDTHPYLRNALSTKMNISCVKGTLQYLKIPQPVFVFTVLRTRS
jgi:hypothetical protein